MRKIIVLTLLLSGCASYDKSALVVDSPAEIPPIHQVYSAQLSRLEPGMTLDSFRHAIPDAYVAGQSELTTAYAVDKTTKYYIQSSIDYVKVWGGTVPTHIDKQTLWFYFYKDRLIKWGRPNDWPQNPDLIIETR